MKELLTKEDVARFHRKYIKTPGCWIWQGRPAHGYGQFKVSHGVDRQFLAHRLAFELAGGTLKEGLVIDHTCENTMCVNPEHLRQVTIGENISLGTGMGVINSSKNYCANGHDITDPRNRRVVTTRNRSRICRECANAYQRAYEARKSYAKI